MIKKLIIIAVACSLSGAMALAGPVEAKSFDGYISDVAKKTGKSEKEVRDEAVDALRKEGKVSEDELERIGRGEDERFDDSRSMELISTLRKSENFQTKTGLSAVRDDSIEKRAGDAFDALKNDDTSSKPVVKADAKISDTDMNKSIVVIGAVSKKISSKAADAIKSVSPQNAKAMQELGAYLVRRVDNDVASREANLKADPTWKPLDPAVAEKLLIDVANTPKALEGQLVIADGAYGACMKMKADAIVNFDDFIDGGLSEGKDPQSFTRGMGRRASEKFKQDLEDGIARVCALASSGCRLFSGAIISACKTLSASKQM